MLSPAITAAALLLSHAETTDTPLRFATGSLDLGCVAAGSDAITCRVPVVNDGDRPREIFRLGFSGSGSRPIWIDEGLVLKPGEWTEAIVGGRAAPMRGQSKTEYKLLVLGQQPCGISLTWRSIPFIEPSVNWIPQGDPISVRLRATDGIPFKVESVHPPGMLRSVVGGESDVATLRLTVLPDSTTRLVVIRTDHPRMRLVKIPVEYRPGLVEPKPSFEIVTEDRLRVIPEIVDVGWIDVGLNQQAMVAVSNGSDERVRFHVEGMTLPPTIEPKSWRPIIFTVNRDEPGAFIEHREVLLGDERLTVRIRGVAGDPEGTRRGEAPPLAPTLRR